MSNKTRLHIRRLITAICVLLIAWLVLSMSEISGHNHSALYGVDKPYSNWNLIVLFSDTLERS